MDKIPASASLLVAFDSNVLTAFLNANSKEEASVGKDLAAFQLFMYARRLAILPTVAREADEIPADDRRAEHVRWIRYHFDEAQTCRDKDRIEARARVLLASHPERDLDDCRIVAEAEVAGADVLATIDKKIKRLQDHTPVQLLTPARALDHIGVKAGDPPQRAPLQDHPHGDATWWRK